MTDVEEFLQEGMMMKDFDHVHVLSLIGVAIQGNNPRIILPFMEFGSLKDFLKNRNQVGNIWTIQTLHWQINKTH